MSKSRLDENIVFITDESDIELAQKNAELLQTLDVDAIEEVKD